MRGLLCAFREHLLVHNHANRRSAIVQGYEPRPAGLICQITHQQARVELPSTAPTRQRLEPRRALPARPHPIRARTAPVAPDRDVLQGLVEMSVLGTNSGTLPC